MSMIKEFVTRVGESEGVRYCDIQGEKDVEVYLFEPTDVVYYKDENFVALDGDGVSVELSADDFLASRDGIYFTKQGMFGILDNATC